MALKIRLKLKEKIIAIISLCLFLQLIISYPLWLDNFRSYPKIPVFEVIEFSFFSSIDFLLFSILLFFLFLFFLGNKNRFIVSLFFTLFTLFILNDINRLQVWSYQLLTMLAVLFLTKESQVKISIRTLQIIMICVYCWGGIQKLNIYFIEDIFPWLLAPFALENYLTNHHFLAYFTAFLELFIGFGLIFKKTRLVFFYVAAGMHLFILVILSPIGHNWNQVVWPWNLCMIGLLYLLFYKNEHSIFNNLLSNFRPFPPLPIILLFFGIMPIFNFYDAWDEQLSFKMYSGVSPEGIFYYQESQSECIPSEVKEYFVHVMPNTKKQRIILDDWAFYNIKVPPYKSKKRILEVGKKLCQCIKKPELAGLELLEVDRWNKGKDSFTNHPCAELLGNKTGSK